MKPDEWIQTGEEMENASSSGGIRKVAVVTAVTAVLVFSASLAYLLSTADDWDFEDIGVSYFDSYLTSTQDSEGDLHLLFVGNAEGVDYGLIYGYVRGEDIEFEHITGEWYHYESLSIAVNSEREVFVAAVVVDEEDYSWNGLFAVREDGQWRSEIVAAPTAPDYMRTYMIGVVIGPDDDPDLFYYQDPSGPQSQYYDPVFVWSTMADGMWNNRTVPVRDLTYRLLYSACCDASGRVHFTSGIHNLSLDVSGRGYSVYDGESITTTVIPGIGDWAPLALDGEDRAVIGVVENTTGMNRFSIASLAGDTWAFDPIADCGTSADIPFVLVDDEGGLHAVLSERIPPPSYDTTVVYASNTEGSWTLDQIDLVQNSQRDACLTVSSDGAVTVYYVEVVDHHRSVTKASSEKDIETLMQPYVDAAEWTVLVTLPLALVGLTAYLVARRATEKKRREEEFKKGADFPNWASIRGPREDNP